MRYIDIFNGDADGILALLQLRLADPQQSLLVTGVKRDNQLALKPQYRQGDIVTVLDLSLEKNINGVNRALAAGATVHYIDHHRSGNIPRHDSLTTNIDTSVDVCTALLIDQQLKGRFHLWAITAAYGDNLVNVAEGLALAQGLSVPQRIQLKELGVLINYNSYGHAIADLHIAPADLYQALLAYHSPFDAIADSDSPYHRLKIAYAEDMQQAQLAEVYYQSDILKVVQLPDQAWARRVSGVLGNDLANGDPERAHIVLSQICDGNFMVSLRAPQNNKQGASHICSQFKTGGGREGAAGINCLAPNSIEALLAITEQFYTERNC
ncbi:DHH family phosphoesterase [Agarivorans sp. QJM3NY_33]|uniref:DHH family phosphoesterase n=1 Tax=Agarivorans sp. QJM3NY_33 TaxID=3421432 RepID=UPI003D7DD4AC